jgi:hypothetical protein
MKITIKLSSGDYKSSSPPRTAVTTTVPQGLREKYSTQVQFKMHTPVAFVAALLVLSTVALGGPVLPTDPKGESVGEPVKSRE